MEVSVAIPTYNRADYLRLTLESLSKLDTSCASFFEIIVVDNCCTDDTVEAVSEYLPRFQGRLRCVKEGKQGLSNARNRAIAEARSEIVAYLDDDVEVDRNWLTALVAAFESESCAVVGGKTYLIYPSARPSWLDDRSEGSLSKVDRGPLRREAKPDEIFGGNIGFRMDWLRRVGIFRPDLGRMGNKLISSEEEELLDRIAASGGRLIYDPSVLIGHRVQPNRLRRRWFWSRSYWGSRGEARMIPPSRISLYEFLRTTWHLGRVCGITCWALFSRGPRSEELFYQTRRMASCLGFWVGLVGRLCRREACERVPVALQVASQRSLGLP